MTIPKGTMNFRKACMALLLILPSCSTKKAETKDKIDRSVIDLAESTHIIRTLIAQNKLDKILEDYDPEKLSILLDNFSPAKMALESEVLSYGSLVVVYYFINNTDEQQFIEQLNELAKHYEDRIKFVVVDAEKLFSLAQDAEIEQYPTILLVKNREIIDRIDKTVTIDLLKQKLSQQKQLIKG